MTTDAKVEQAGAWEINPTVIEKHVAKTVKVDVRPSQLEYLVDRLDTIIEFFEHRDEMNAKVHLDGVRLSPITLAAHDVRTELQTLWQEAVAAMAQAE